jgi:hypothetical protein
LLPATGGNVGIGTTTFVGSIKLAVNGQIGGSTFSSTYLDLTGGTPELRGNSGIGFYGSAGNHIFYGSSSTERMRIIGSTGNVSIGTTNSFDRLQNNGGMCFGAFNNATINYGMGEGNHTYLQFATNGVNVMRISATQNVLINTTTDAGYTISANGTGGGNGFLSGGNSYLQFSVRGLNFLTIYNGGNEANTAYQMGYSLAYNGTPPNLSALLDLTSTTKGFLPPRMTQAQRNAIASPAIGLEIYQTDATEGKYIYKSSGWTYIG